MNSLPLDKQMPPNDLSPQSSTGPNAWKLENTLIGTIQELSHIATRMAGGVSATYDAQCRYVDASNQAQKAYALAFMNCQGTVKDREQIALLQSEEAQVKAEMAKAEWDRCKLQMKQLEMQQMSVQTKARLLETELKTLK